MGIYAIIAQLFSNGSFFFGLHVYKENISTALKTTSQVIKYMRNDPVTDVHFYYIPVAIDWKI